MIKQEVICDYCTHHARLVDGFQIYPHRHDLRHKWFYQCLPCKAYVGCHPGTQNSLGRLANGELRKWKNAAHVSFDAIWKRGLMGRTKAYRLLAEKMDIPDTEDTHDIPDILPEKHRIHVIEYSAYDQAIARAETLESLFKEWAELLGGVKMWSLIKDKADLAAWAAKKTRSSK